MVDTIEEKEAIPLRKFYRAKVNITEKGRKFLEKIEEFPYYIEELVEAKIPYGDAKMGITKILSVEKIVQNDADEAQD